MTKIKLIKIKIKQASALIWETDGTGILSPTLLMKKSQLGMYLWLIPTDKLPLTQCFCTNCSEYRFLTNAKQQNYAERRVLL